MKRPPRAAVALLRRLLVPQYRQLILDDLDEEYRRRVGSSTMSARAADRWYWGEVLRSIRPSLEHRLRLRRGRGPHRDEGRFLVDGVLADLRQAGRRLAAAPGFAAAAVITLALGIAANSAIFALVNSVLLRPLPYAEPDRLAWVAHSARGLGVDEIYVSYGSWLHYRERSETIEDFALLVRASANLTGSDGPERLDAVAVTSNLLSTLGARPALGRDFAVADGEYGAPSVVLLSHDLWRRRFGADPAVLGRTLTLNARPREVIGILPEGLAFPTPGVDVWFAMQVPPEEIRFGGFFNSGYARLRRGVTAEQVRDELDRLIPMLSDVYDVPAQMIADAQIRAVVTPLRERLVGDVGRSLWILLATVGVVLLIACTNIANLFLVRADGRHREVAVRQALGASRAQIVRYFLAETVVLAMIGWVLGLAGAWASLRAVVRSGVDIPRLHEVGLDGSVVLVSLALAAVAGVLFGSFPVVRSMRAQISAALRDDTRCATVSGARLRGRGLLVAAQVAFALTLLVSSGLMVQSFWRMSRVDLGYEPAGVLTAEVVLPEAVYADKQQVAAFYYAAIDQLGKLPGVEAAAVATDLPLTGSFRIDPLYREGIDDPDGEVLPPAIHYSHVTPGYFKLMGIPLEEGRLFTQADEGTAPVLVTRSLAQEFWPGGPVLGQRVLLDWPGERRWMTVIGITGALVHESVTEGPSPVLYLPILHGDNSAVPFLPSFARLLVRVAGDPMAIAGLVPGAVWEVDANVPIANLRPHQAIVDDATARARFTMSLLAIAATVAVLLGAIGLYGVVSYTVSQRTREIGVRLALGARAVEVRAMVLRQGMAVTVAGLVAGLVLSLGVTRVLQSLLFEISASDPVTFALAPLLLFLVAWAATWLPALRASRVDPVEGLRAE